MKKLIGLLSIIAFFAFSPQNSAIAQVVVVKPNAPKVLVVKPNQHKAGYIWKEGHWRWNGKKYVWVKAQWVQDRPGYVWVSGHWVSTNAGHRWVDGHWKKKTTVKRPVKKAVKRHRRNH